MSEFDAIIVGAGAAGGIVAAELATAGKRVLLLERGRELSYEDVPLDHLRNHRLALYGHGTGPDLEGHPRVFAPTQGDEMVVPPHHWAYHNNAMCVGGGTRVFGAQAWRFLEKDFRMASEYGTPSGSSLADWPIGYDELEEYYDRAEYEIGVSGDAAAHAGGPPRTRGYPMPPGPANASGNVLARGAKKLGWNTFPAPLLINSVTYNGRPACVQCNACVGFACPSESKNGTHNTAIPKALATGKVTLVTGAQAERIETNANGRATGVSYWIHRPGRKPERVTAGARLIVASAGAIESARLLLNSKTAQEPDGLGNNQNQVGRSLQGHVYTGAFGRFREPVQDGKGPGVTLATTRFNHGNDGIVGGGMLANEFVVLPIIFWRANLPPRMKRWGAVNKAYMRDAYTRTMKVQGPVQDIPSPEGRVTVDPKVRDVYGIPVARLSGTTHPETIRTANFMRTKAEEWLTASGAEEVWSYPNGLGLSGHQHQAGTCRMGNDPTSSVTDPRGRVHGHENVYVVDGSLHVTNGGFNPVLTIMALAFRSGAHLARL